MSILKVTKTRLVNGTWEGVISDVPEDIRPGIAVRFRDRALDDISVTPATGGTWRGIAGAAGMDGMKKKGMRLRWANE